MQACVQVSGEICAVPLEIVLYFQSNQSNVTESVALSMGVSSLKSYCCGMTVIGICDYKSVQVLFSPELQVGTELS